MISAVVFKITGNPAVGGPIKDGIEKGTRLASEELALVRDELDRLKAKEAVRDARDAAYFQDMILDAREEYAPSRPPCGISEKLLQLYALLCLGVDTAFKRLQAINREA